MSQCRKSDNFTYINKTPVCYKTHQLVLRMFGLKWFHCVNIWMASISQKKLNENCSLQVKNRKVIIKAQFQHIDTGIYIVEKNNFT